MNFNFLCGTSAKDSKTSTFPSAGHTLRLCPSNLLWLSFDSTGRGNHLPEQKTHKTLLLNFLRNVISDTSGIFPLTINPPNLCFLISKHTSLFRQRCFKLRKRNILLKNKCCNSYQWDGKGDLGTVSSSWNLVGVLIQTEVAIYWIINRWGSLLSQMF